MVGCLGPSRAAQDSDVVARAVAAGLAATATGGYVLTRPLSGGFLGDHRDVGNWNCPLGVSALSTETLIIFPAAGWGAWQAWSRRVHRPRRPRALRVLPASSVSVARPGPAAPPRPVRPRRRHLRESCSR